MLALSSFLDLLFESNEPVWCYWDENLPALTSALKDRLCDYFRRYQQEKNYSDEKFSHYNKISLALWLLDRLLPLDDNSIFVPFLGEKALHKLEHIKYTYTPVSCHPHIRAIYAWGRRLSAEQRNQIFAIPFNQSAEIGKFTAFCLINQAALAAWIETCPADQSSSLFTWPDLCDLYQSPHPPKTTKLLTDEYIRRNADRNERLSVLAASAEKLIEHRKEYGKWDWGVIRSDLLNNILRQIIKDMAPEFSSTEESPPIANKDSVEALFKWFLSILARTGYSTIADLYQHLNPHREGYSLAILFWIETMNWPQLEERMHRLEKLSPYDFINRMVEIVPPERLDVWETVLELKRYYPITAFCRWLRPEYREVLLWHCNPYELNDEAICAFYAYLSMTPRPLLEAMWKRTELIPSWQAQALDRYLYAPEPIKPPPFLWDVQCAEADPRLEDPLTCRGL